MWRKKKCAADRKTVKISKKNHELSFSHFVFFSQTQISLRAAVGAFVQIPVMSFKIAFLSTWHTFKQNAKVWANYYIIIFRFSQG